MDAPDRHNGQRDASLRPFVRSSVRLCLTWSLTLTAHRPLLFSGFVIHIVFDS